MNSCRMQVRAGNWSSCLDIIFSRTKTWSSRRGCARPPPPPPLSRSRTTAAEPAPEQPGGKPRRRAIDLAQKIRQEKTEPPATEAPVSGQQQRVSELKRFSTQLQNVHRNVLAKHLSRSVLYRDIDLVVINKPYGVPVRDNPSCTSISSVLPVLSKMLHSTKVKSESELHIGLALEKEVTGALLLARSEDAAERVLNLSRYNQVQRKYWVITVGVPVPSEGMIDIPIIEREVTGPQPHYKMGLSPLFKMNDAGNGVTKVRGERKAQPAVTKYRVLHSSSGCSLVELQPFTAVKHQMRVHMAFALACPILGDHKYSHWSKLAPQKLPERVLGKLGLEQSKSRHLPLHLHARQLTVEGTRQRDISVLCPLPKFFQQTLSRLNLMVSDDTDDKNPPP